MAVRGTKMLDFIVLGIVPGTNVTITFGWIVAIFASFIGMLAVYYELKRFRKMHQQATPSDESGLVNSTALPA